MFPFARSTDLPPEAADADPSAAGLLARLRSKPTAELEDAARQLAALADTAMAHALLVLGVLDERGVGPANGSVDTAAWWGLTSGRSRADARSQTATALALPHLPQLAEAAVAGELTAPAVELVAQVANSEDEASWVDLARRLDPAALASKVRAAKRVTDREAAEGQARARFRWRHDRRSGLVRYNGQMPAELAAPICTGLDRRASQMLPVGDEPWAPYEERCAQALADLAAEQLAADPDTDRATVVVHAPLAALEPSVVPSPDGASAVVDVPGVGELPIASCTVHRLMCDGRLETVIEGIDGTPYGVGRRERTVPPKMARVVRHRDGGRCRIPGCEHRHGVQVHHIVHWADGGRTDVVNLVSLCPFHHRLVHEGGWTLGGDPQAVDGIVLVDPRGRRSAGHPPPLRPVVRERFLVG